LELEADREGLQLLLKNNINPKGMLSLLEKLKQQNSGSSVPEFLSTHPLPDSRIEALKKLLVNHSETSTHSDLDSVWLKLKLL
jgi:predicted Zn-dependent protease